MPCTKYPLIFVHGMFGWGENEGINKYAPYWGATSGNLIEQLRDMGCEAYAASVGPVSSAWDQACELYAQLTGTQVDYGEAHAKKYGHKRFGRVYEKPLFEGWNSEKKIHLIGHSFGGNTVRLMAHLLAYGAPEEVEETGKGTSMLFVGGQADLIHSITAICSPMNGTGAYEAAKRAHLLKPLKTAVYTYAGILGRSRFNGKTVDFHLERTGLTDTPGKHDHEPLLITVKKQIHAVDSIDHDMSPEGSKELNSKIEILPDTYYFSYPFNVVREKKNGYRSPVDAKFILLFVTSKLMLRNEHPQAENDGLVDVPSAMHPENEPYEIFSITGEIKPGIWNVMPTAIGDHGTAIGLFADKTKTLSFYLEMIGRLKETEKEEVTV